jgi:hypothetical protein
LNPATGARDIGLREVRVSEETDTPRSVGDLVFERVADDVGGRPQVQLVEDAGAPEWRAMWVSAS